MFWPLILARNWKWEKYWRLVAIFNTLESLFTIRYVMVTELLCFLMFFLFQYHLSLLNDVFSFPFSVGMLSQNLKCYPVSNLVWPLLFCSHFTFACARAFCVSFAVRTDSILDFLMNFSWKIQETVGAWPSAGSKSYFEYWNSLSFKIYTHNRIYHTWSLIWGYIIHFLFSSVHLAY